MGSIINFRSIFVLALIILSIYGLVPTYKYYTMPAETKLQLDNESDPSFLELRSKILNLGLDLQGGMHMVVEMDLKAFLQKIAVRQDEDLAAAIEIAIKDEITPIQTLRSELEKRGKDLVRYFGNRRNRSEDSDDEIQTGLIEKIDSAIDGIRDKISNRVDQFGVAEPIIQRLGERRIIIELAGAVNPERIRGIIRKTAQLDFAILPDAEEGPNVFKVANDFYKLKFDIKDDLVDTVATDSAKTGKAEDAAELFGATGSENDTTKVADKVDSGYDKVLFIPLTRDASQSYAVLPKNKGLVEDLIGDPEFVKYLKANTGNYRLLFEKPRVPIGQRPPYYSIMVVRDRIVMTGDGITDAKSLRDPDAIDGYYVQMRLDDESSIQFASLTGRNVQKRMAIILDNIVQSAPTIIQRITGGRPIITGLDLDESRDLSIVLRIGALDAPLQLIEEQTVGASLGDDSVKAGTASTIGGLILVLIFMVIYYKKGGAIASMAVIVNLIFMGATLAAFSGTLTLPGIAGIILTIGMSVDANVLIFERIREEIAAGVTAFNALENGYSKAIVTILDANITTFIAGVVLFSFGSGTIRGFALTLMIGILSSLITAVIMTRAVFEMTTDRKATQLSI